ncbi:MAG: histidine ammonia-lyase, partial [Thermoproteota archaeon]
MGLSLLHTVEDVVAVARWRRRAEVTEEDLRRVKEGRRRLESLISKGYLIYGVTTSFGPLCNRVVPKRKAEVIQWKLVVSHASNAGELLPEEAVRAGMYCRLLVLLKGSSGVRPEVVELLAEMLNREVTPAVPELGSVGASGDLGHLAHIAAAMAGEGEAFYRGELLPAAEALRKAGLKPVKLSYKEGLALING